jgi:hypothetical protein
VLLEWGSHSAFSQLALNAIKFEKKPLHRPFEKQFYFSTTFSKRRTEFTRNKTFSTASTFWRSMQVTFSSYFDYFQDEE